MDIPHEGEEGFIKIERPKKSVVWVVWNIMFALFYPVLAVFSIFIMVLMFISSTLSKGISWIANLFSRS
jgi:hypothetical protein